VSVLKWLTVSLFAYVAVALIVDIPWETVAANLFVPHITRSGAYLTAVVAILGTTISPYLFFWQAEEEVEEIRERAHAKPLSRAPEQAAAEFGRIRVDTYIGMGLSNLVALFSSLTAAATLHANGVTDIQTSAQAAEALRPIAGRFAFFVFALGIIGTGMLALPVLAGSSAYALGETFGWHVGLARKPARAKAFYGCIAVATLLGVLLNFSPIDPIKALFWCAVINGIIAVPIMVVMMLLADDPKVMGAFAVTRRLKTLGWLATWTMAAAVIAMFAVAG
jgi:Mn2+/Fe2+ NRAMP family transporter